VLGAISNTAILFPRSLVMFVVVRRLVYGAALIRTRSAGAGNDTALIGPRQSILKSYDLRFRLSKARHLQFVYGPVSIMAALGRNTLTFALPLLFTFVYAWILVAADVKTQAGSQGIDLSAKGNETRDFEPGSLAVAVGTIIADRPPHRSVRALLRIRLPPWMVGVKALHRIRMENTSDWNPAVHEPVEPSS